jgi:hypothetical protein
MTGQAVAQPTPGGVQGDVDLSAVRPFLTSTRPARRRHGRHVRTFPDPPAPCAPARARAPQIPPEAANERPVPRQQPKGAGPVTGAQRSPQPPQRYEIRVRGHLGAIMRRGFPALSAEIQGGDTLLQGPIADQSALHGILSQIEALGLELLELRRLPHAPAEPGG